MKKLARRGKLLVEEDYSTSEVAQVLAGYPSLQYMYAFSNTMIKTPRWISGGLM